MSQPEAALRIASPAWKFFLPVAGLAIAVAFWSPWVALVPVVLALYILYFFRDPGRRVPSIPGAFVSPADGKVVSVIEVPCDQMPGGRALRVAIFLNVFNVHIQRVSQDASVTKVDRQPGKFINALNEKCSEENERVTVWLEGQDGVFGIRQIAGAIARRIVCNVQPGDVLKRGERYGLIQFGSRVELFLPLDASVKVEPGQFVRGGETTIALFNEADIRKGRVPSQEEVTTQPAPTQPAQEPDQSARALAGTP